MKVKSEDILKPGVVLKVEKIDWSNPDVKQMVTHHHRQCEHLKKMNRWTQRKALALQQVITL